MMMHHLQDQYASNNAAKSDRLHESAHAGQCTALSHRMPFLLAMKCKKCSGTYRAGCINVNTTFKWLGNFHYLDRHESETQVKNKS